MGCFESAVEAVLYDWTTSLRRLSWSSSSLVVVELLEVGGGSRQKEEVLCDAQNQDSEAQNRYPGVLITLTVVWQCKDLLYLSGELCERLKCAREWFRCEPRYLPSRGA